MGLGGWCLAHVVTTLAESLEQVRLVIQPLLPPLEKDAPQSGPTVMEMHP